MFPLMFLLRRGPGQSFPDRPHRVFANLAVCCMVQDRITIYIIKIALR